MPVSETLVHYRLHSNTASLEQSGGNTVTRNLFAADNDLAAPARGAPALEKRDGRTRPRGRLRRDFRATEKRWCEINTRFDDDYTSPAIEHITAVAPANLSHRAGSGQATLLLRTNRHQRIFLGKPTGFFRLNPPSVITADISEQAPGDQGFGPFYGHTHTNICHCPVWDKPGLTSKPGHPMRTMPS